MEEKILLNIGIDEGEIGKAVKAIQEARTKIDALKKAQKELEAQGQANSEQYILQEQEIKKLNKEVSDNSKIIQTNTSMIKANEGSIEALRKANAALTKERNALNINTEEGQKRIAEINEELDRNNQAIKSNVSVLEQQKINIGNYASALDNLVPGLGAVTNNITNITQAEGGFIQGMKGMITQSLAFLATPIGLVLAAIGAALGVLVTFLKNSTAGMDLFEDATTVVSTVLNILIDRVVSVAKAIGSLLIMDFAGFAEHSQAAFSGLGDELQREVGLALELASAMRDLEDAEIAHEIAASKNDNTIKRLLIAAKDRSLAEEDRIKLAQRAMEIEGEQAEQNVKNKEEALRIANEEAAMRVGLARIAGESEEEYGQRIIETGLALDEQRDKIKDAIIARNNAEGQSLAFQEKVQNQINALAEKAEADRQKREEKARADREKRLEEIRKNAETEAQAARDLTIFTIEEDIKRTTSIDERIKKEIALETVKRDFLLQNDKLTNAERALISAQYQQALTDIEAKGVADRKALFDADNAARAEEFDKNFEAFLQRIEEEFQVEVNKEKEKYLNGLISREEYDQQLLDAELAALLAEQELKRQFGEEDLRLAGSITDAKIAMKEREREINEEVERQKYEVASQVFGQTAALFNKNSLAYKLAASAEAAINTYKAATSAYAAGSALPPPAGIVMGPILAAIAIASGLANVAKINSVKLPKLAQGDMIPISGKDHSQGGEVVSIGNKPVAEVQGGEHMVIMKRGANEQLKLLSEANKRAGGKDFFRDRRPVRYAADGGFVGRTVSNTVNQNLLAQDIGKVVSGAIEQMPPQYLKVTDLERVQTNKARVAKISELG